MSTGKPIKPFSIETNVRVDVLVNASVETLEDIDNALVRLFFLTKGKLDKLQLGEAIELIGAALEAREDNQIERTA